MKQLRQILEGINANRLIQDRLQYCAARGFETDIVPMGCGGVGQWKQMRDGSVRVQISHGWGRYNYAHVAIINPNQA